MIKSNNFFVCLSSLTSNSKCSKQIYIKKEKFKNEYKLPFSVCKNKPERKIHFSKFLEQTKTTTKNCIQHKHICIIIEVCLSKVPLFFLFFFPLKKMNIMFVDSLILLFPHCMVQLLLYSFRGFSSSFFFFSILEDPLEVAKVTHLDPFHYLQEMPFSIPMLCVSLDGNA